jgi:hypothetical protein
MSPVAAAEPQPIPKAHRAVSGNAIRGGDFGNFSGMAATQASGLALVATLDAIIG